MCSINGLRPDDGAGFIDQNLYVVNGAVCAVGCRIKTNDILPFHLVGDLLESVIEIGLLLFEKAAAGDVGKVFEKLDSQSTLFLFVAAITAPTGEVWPVATSSTAAVGKSAAGKASHSAAFASTTNAAARKSLVLP